jgi:hypothetical protein
VARADHGDFADVSVNAVALALAAPDFKTRETKWETKVRGFTMDACDRIVTDNLAHTVTWKGNADLSALKGRSVYLRFKMKWAGFFGFQIAP